MEVRAATIPKAIAAEVARAQQRIEDSRACRTAIVDRGIIHEMDSSQVLTRRARQKQRTWDALVAATRELPGGSGRGEMT